MSTISPDDRASRAAVAELQRPGVDGGAAGVGVVSGQRHDTRAVRDECAGAADDSGIGERVAAVEREHAVVDDIAEEPARGAAIADLQRAGRDGRAAGIGLVRGQCQRAGADLDERAGAADDAAIGERVAAVERRARRCR